MCEETLSQYVVVRVRALLQAEDAYDPWRLNVRSPQLDDLGVIVEVLSTPGFPHKYVIENSDSDGRTIWLSEFVAEEIMPI